MHNKVILREVAEEARQADAKRLRSALFEDCRSLVSELEGDVSGYALVAWTPQGELRSVYHTGRGPLRPAVIPVLVQDALSRHVAKDMAAPVRISNFLRPPSDKMATTASKALRKGTATKDEIRSMGRPA